MMRITSVFALFLAFALTLFPSFAQSAYGGSDEDCPCRYLGVGVPWGEYSEPSKLVALVDGKAEAYILVDVRSPEEYASGHIRTAINIPVTEIAAHPPTEQKNALIIVYCRSGVRSAKAAAILKKLGYKGGVDFGGVSRWPGPLVVGSQP
jgi:rhodanese-related sulfurtransferase